MRPFVAQRANDVRGGSPHLLECAYALTQNGHRCGIVCWKPDEPCPFGVPENLEPATVEAWLRS